MFTKKRVAILGIVVLVGFYLGALATRAIINLMIGGTLFGGNFLWEMKRREIKQVCLYFYV